MFTGLVREVGRIRAVREGSATGDTRFEILSARPAREIEIGASIAVSGVCLTAVEVGSAGTGSWFAVEASGETLSATTAGDWRPETPVNLEPALRVGDELGGHIVAGHVDGVAEVTDVRPEGGSHRLTIRVPDGLARYVAPKGSVALDGISLTVNEVSDARFGVNIIPHTWTQTTLAGIRPGSRLNLEVDLLARYVARLAEIG
ncbi:MAG: riboflavin synthase [Paracoccaceae bacterium]